MSIYTATYNALIADANLAGLIALNPLDAQPAVYESYALHEAEMPYIVINVFSAKGSHFAKKDNVVTLDIFADGDSVAAEAIKNRCIKILDRQLIAAENENVIRFYYNQDSKIDEPETDVTHWNLEFNAFYWRKNFIEYFNNL